MAVETLYRSTRDLETTFVDRKLADAHDQMLELAESLMEVLLEKRRRLEREAGRRCRYFHGQEPRGVCGGVQEQCECIGGDWAASG